MEAQREDLVVILAGYGDRMEKFFQSNPGFRSRIAHHIDFPDYSGGELLLDRRADVAAAELSVLSRSARGLHPIYRHCARSSRCSPMRVRSAMRSTVFDCVRPIGSWPKLDRTLTADDVMSIEAGDVLASRVFGKGIVAAGEGR